MENLLEGNDRAAELADRSERLRDAASSNLAWSNGLFALLILCGLSGGGIVGANSVGPNGDGTVPALFGAFLGLAFGVVLGKTIHTRNLVACLLAIQLDTYARENRQGTTL